MVNPDSNDFHLREDSPCIDAGDPALPHDLDGTIRDQGASSFFQSPILVTIGSGNPCIIIPASGGSFNYWVRVESAHNEPYTFDIWTEAVLPGGNVFGPLVSRQNLVILAGATARRDMNQSVPGSAPSGFYYLRVIVGFLPDSVLDSDILLFTKLAGDGAPNHNNGWLVEGWFGDEIVLSLAPTEFELRAPYPNPFNPTTRIDFMLPQAGKAQLTVFDVTGREVATLIDGEMPAGYHSAIFDGERLASGIYFYKLTADGFSDTKKMALVK